MRYRIASLLVVPTMLFGCAIADRHTETGLSDGSTVHTLHCRNGWAGCYQSAQDVCGSAGFDEVNRVLDGKVTSAGHLARMHSIEGGIEDHVYSEEPRNDVFDRTITIRCKRN